MALSFNTAGPCHPYDHYLLRPERRVGQVMKLIEKRRYFNLLGGHQTGKTTSLQWLAAQYNQGDACRALWIDLQPAHGEPDPARAFPAVLRALDYAVERMLPGLGPPAARTAMLSDPSTVILFYLQEISRRCPGPLVVFFDDADGLVGGSLVSFLTQLRDGYVARRLSPFPHSVVMVGQREARIEALGEREREAIRRLGATSPFTSGVAAVRLELFTEPDVEALLAQHTAATGQRFEPAAVARIFALSQGHPWLVNALAERITEEDVIDRAVAVTDAHVESARESVVTARRTHLDTLVRRLRDPVVQRILDPMIAGAGTPADVGEEDLAQVIDLGLVCIRGGSVEIANPIYCEAIPRSLTYVRQVQIPLEAAAFVRPDGSLDLPGVMSAWQIFWREDGHLAAAGLPYRESGPHLMLMAFLQRVVEGEGRVERTYALGRGALDLVVEWRGARYAVEARVRHETRTEARALSQAAQTLEQVGLPEGWLVLFDLQSSLPWDRRLTARTLEVGSKKVHVVGC
jgi:hypothetical protein